MDRRADAAQGTPKVCPKTGKVIQSQNRSRWFLFFYLATGLSALVWFLARVLPKPSRAAYPCQRVAMPLASSFVLWVLGLAGTIFAFRRAARNLRKARYVLAALCGAAGIGIAIWALSLPDEPALAEWEPDDAPNTPVGVGKGIHPGRVVWAHDPEATSWDGSSNYWWSGENLDQDRVDAMMSKSVRQLAGESTDGAAWDAIFHQFNNTHDRGDVGYKAGEGIAIKINMNVAGDYSLTNEPIASPQAVRALLWQLVHQAGVTESAISVYDASRCINDAIFTPCHSEFPAVTFVDSSGGGDRDRPIADETTAVHYGDARVQYSGSTRLPKCVVESSYLINMALLRGHSMAGVTLCAKNHFGSVHRNGSWSPSHIHTSISKSANAMGTENSLVDLMGHEHLDGKGLLFIIDGLYGAVNQSSSRPTRWRSSPFDNHWSSSLFLSQDGVAIDSVGVDFCRSEPNLSGSVTGQSVDNYLHEAALADNPPSGAVYDPEGDGTRLASLGVHEHWNNARDRQYSKNLGTGEGIELITITNTGGFRRGDTNADAVATLLYLFGGGAEPSCLSSADTDDTGGLELTDAVFLLNFLFAAGSEPPPPFGQCGADPTEDALSCEGFTPCGSGAGTRVTLLSPETRATVMIPSDGDLGLGWTERDFDDTAWIAGEAAVGYDENDTYLDHITTDVDLQMNGVHPTVYIRVPFTVDTPASLSRITLWVQYDDGYVAYINGTKVAERNAPTSPAWDSVATDQHPDDEAVLFESVTITNATDILVPGENTLAIHGLNVSLTSSDFLIAAELDARKP